MKALKQKSLTEKLKAIALIVTQSLLEFNGNQNAPLQKKKENNKDRK